MGTSKLIEKLQNFFDLSESKQREKHHKLLEIIDNLEKKKSKLELEIQSEREFDAYGSRLEELEKELAVVSNLISKAKQKNLAE